MLIGHLGDHWVESTVFTDLTPEDIVKTDQTAYVETELSILGANLFHAQLSFLFDHYEISD